MPIIAHKAFKDNYIWTICNKNSMIAIDPGEAEALIEFAKNNNFTLTHILVTHHHFDHTNGIIKLTKHFPKVVIIAPDDARIEKIHIKAKPDSFVKIENYIFKVLFTPGHTSSHVCYHETQKNWLFSGDTLFSAGCGRLFEGTMQQLYDSLQTLQQLPATTKVYAGHEYTRQNLRFALSLEPNNKVMLAHDLYLKEHPEINSLPSTIALEKEINVFLRTNTEALQKFALANNISRDPLDIFQYIRKLKDNF